ncbi:MAG: SurA N-terminal domain-containing protein [Magnetococcales bacterium]|nr:SurA N-terminal domain-containing protein [Magnetococcales bacterium]
MLNLMRRSAKSFVIKLLLGFLILSFMAWGVESYIRVNTRSPLVEADGWQIGAQEFSVAYEEEFQRLRERFGGSLDKKTAEMLGLKQRTLHGLINRHLILRAARELHLTVAPNILRQRIESIPAFQVEKRFSKERYELELRRNRLGPKEFEGQLTSDVVSDQIRRAVTAPVLLPKVLVDDLYRLEHEKRAVVIFTVDSKALEEGIKPTDEELEAYLKQNPEPFKTKAKVKIRYALLNVDSVRSAVQVSDEELREFYTEHAKEYRKEENRQVRHILARIDDKTDAAAANEKIRKAEERLKAGESFEAVAKALSDDPSAAQGGDLGVFGLGVMVPEFEKVAFALETGKVSEPVTTDFGVHLIRVDRIIPAEVKPLEQVATEIRGRIVENKAKDLVHDRATIFEDQLAASGDLKTISNDLNLRFKETDFWARDDADRTGVELEAKFVEAAFATAKGAISSLVELPNTQFVAIEVVDRQEPTPKTLEQAREEVVRACTADQARQQAQKIMESVVKALGEGKSVTEVSALHPRIQSATPEPFLREGAEKEPGPRTREAAFKLHPDKPNHPEILQEEGYLAAVRLLKVIDAAPQEEENQEAAKEWRAKIEGALGQEQLIAYLNGLWIRSNIRIHQEVLDRL